MKKVFLVIICCFIVFIFSCKDSENKAMIDSEGEVAETQSDKRHPDWVRYEEAKFADSFFFYIPGDEEVANYIEFIQALQGLNSGNMTWEEDQLFQLFDELYGGETLHSLELEAFLLGTVNKEIQIAALKNFKEKGVSDSFVKALERKINSVEEIVPGNEEVPERLIYNYKDLNYDENINLFSSKDANIFEGRLGLFLIENEWSIISYPPKENPNYKEDSFFVMTGGGTNAMHISFTEYKDIVEEDFIAETDNPHYTGKYKNWEKRELSIEGMLKRANADRIFLGVGSGPEVFEEIDSASAVIYLYNSKLKRGYSVSYNMNYSKINNNYHLRKRQWNQLLFLSLFTYINE